MSQNKLPPLSTSGGKAVSNHGKRGGSTTLQQTGRRKRGVAPQNPRTVHYDTMTPWEGPSLSDSSFTSIPRPAAPPPAPIPPPSPPLPPVCITAVPADHPPRPGGVQSGRSERTRRRPLPPRRPPRPPRLPPLRPVSNLSFTRSFTFSFFELPVHQSSRCRAERLRDVAVLLRQIQY